MKKKKLNLLVLEDNPDDAELAVRELEQEGFNVGWSRVDTEEAFRKALGEKPDLILADYRLPSFDARAALQIQQQITPEIPLIIVSGTIGEEVVVECIKSGATDYVLKDMLSRLGPVVKRALEEAETCRERKQAEEEKKKLEAQLQRAQKTEAIGTLAGGIAHDFNNLLAVIIGYTELAMGGVPADSLTYSNLNEVLKAGLLAKDLVQQILAFSRRAEEERGPVQIDLIVKEALNLLRSSLPTTIEIRRDIAAANMVLGDATQIHQVLMNLCVNASHAMNDKGGVLEVRLRNVECGVRSVECGMRN